jgi:hypothetical protein|tara:strand:+ start:309 stop:482 length:174 start_codon:yes stop_codon:yes gene_type:complete
MSEERCKRYSDCTLDELAEIVQDLENMSYAAEKPDMIKLIFEAVTECKKEIEKRLKK